MNKGEIIMSTIALNNQNVYVNNKAEKKVEKKMSVWAKIGAFIFKPKL